MGPDRDDLVHKRHQATQRIAKGSNPRSRCGRYGYVTTLWKNVNCEACLATKVKR